ncbi:uncharacterized protein LOC142327445 isoform X2 [Lycorma delicatula]|uniref:uncharacterized protein LOC142327445 isoform X2 n=1 Tax=Lycorma delicatula TaxID=130591 RepID=UPI003F50DC93
MKKFNRMRCEKLESFGTDQTCVFCEANIVDELKLGTIYKYGSIVTHYFCLLLSSNMEQNGQDDEGIYGFLPVDIEKEVKRGKKLRCTICRKRGATLNCSVTKCKVVFHLPCGVNKGSLHQFYGQFKSFCVLHRPRQRINEDILKLARTEPGTCPICYDTIVLNHDSTMWAPCCKKNAFFHRNCVQKLANSFGSYAFRCPLCNDQHLFTKTMKDFGIYIPERDASWEQEENAFQELLFRHNRCDAQKCICPHGREFNKQTSRWHLILCRLCGSKGIHNACRLKKSNEWQCDNCITMLSHAEKGSSSDEGEAFDSLPDMVPNCRQQNIRISKPSSSITDLLTSNDKKLRKMDSLSTSSFKDEDGDHNEDDVCHTDKNMCAEKQAESSSLHQIRSKSASPELELSPKARWKSEATLASSRSSSVVSVTRSVSPVLIIDSDESSDVEVVGDITRDVLINREGNKIQIVHLADVKKPDCVEIQGDLNVKDVEVECGIRMTNSLSQVKTESVTKKRRTSCHSISNTYVSMEKQTSCRGNEIILGRNDNEISSYTTENRVGKSLFNTSATNSSASDVRPYNVGFISSSQGITGIVKNLVTASSNDINIYKYNDSVMQQPQVFIDNKDHASSCNTAFVHNNSIDGSSSMFNNHIQKQPSLDRFMTATMSEIQKPRDIMSVLPSRTIVKIRESVTEDKQNLQVGEYHNDIKSTAINKSNGEPKFTHRRLQCSDATKGKFESSARKCSSSYEKPVCTRQIEASSLGSKTRCDNIRLKKQLKVVVTPIPLNILKVGITKVPKKKDKLSKSSDGFTKSDYSFNSDKYNKILQKSFYNKVVKHKNNLFLRSIYNSIVIKNKIRKLSKDLMCSYRSNCEIIGMSLCKRENRLLYSVLKDKSIRPEKRKRHKLEQNENESAEEPCIKRRSLPKDFEKYFCDKSNLIHSSEKNKKISDYSHLETAGGTFKQYGVTLSDKNSVDLLTHKDSFKKINQCGLCGMFYNKTMSEKQNCEKNYDYGSKVADLNNFTKHENIYEKLINYKSCDAKYFVCKLCSTNEFMNFKNSKSCCLPTASKTNKIKISDHIQKANILLVDKELKFLPDKIKFNSSITDIWYKYPEPYSFISDTKLSTMIDFPCNEFNSLCLAHCLTFISFPISIKLVNKFILSSITFKIKRLTLHYGMICYQFSLFVDDIPIIIIKFYYNNVIIVDDNTNKDLISEIVRDLNRVKLEHNFQADAESEDSFSDLDRNVHPNYTFCKKKDFESFLTLMNLTNSKDTHLSYILVDPSPVDLTRSNVKNLNDNMFLVSLSVIGFCRSKQNDEVSMKLLFNIIKDNRKCCKPNINTFKLTSSLLHSYFSTDFDRF